MSTESLPDEPRTRPDEATSVAVASQGGLTTAAARQRLADVGPNTLPDTTVNPLVQAVKKFWAPVP